ncbi:hypothetical protein [Thalassobius sp. Cn5-15]|uniref:phage head spike fiber domain-containing protein n=1 Tax=Thalassobius sp. Cn5-15 TaxID=2917763 RepID=UPI001EF3862B|nr:hypothetical protein [Thalassobius sp. Cn5-15]MCG7495075.1 hypothetical protein [Thalassobius sp. Cn5-15]
MTVAIRALIAGQAARRTSYASGGIEPVAVWDFSVGHFSHGFTLSRPSEAVGYDGAGRFVGAAPDELRYDRRGLLPAALFEGAASNLLSHSAAAISNGWVGAGATAVDLSGNALGQFHGCAIQAVDAAWNRLQHAATPALVSGVPYRVTLWFAFGTVASGLVVLRNDATGDETQVYLTPGVANSGIQNAGAITDLSMVEVGVDQAIHLSFTFVPNFDGGVSFGFGPGSDVAGAEVVLFAAQMEAGTAASSYIHSGGSPALRAADQVDWQAPTGIYDLRLMDGAGVQVDQLAVTVGPDWQPAPHPLSVSRVLLYPSGTLPL